MSTLAVSGAGAYCQSVAKFSFTPVSAAVVISVPRFARWAQASILAEKSATCGRELDYNCSQMTGFAGPSSPPPARAAVSPRVHIAGGGAAQPLDRLINELLAKHARGAVLLTGTAGGGKT